MDNFFRGASFSETASLFSLTSPNNGGLIDPFTQSRYGPMGKEAFLLKPGKFSKQIENLDGTWSIIYLENFLDHQFIPLSRVESKIKNQLKKELQKKIREDLYISLFKQYNVWINSSFLSINN